MGQTPVLVVIGAGPKAAAIATKAAVLRESRQAPDVLVLEQLEKAAHWRGNHGFTDGTQQLCTSPLRDVGFPYHSTFGPEVDDGMHRYSWCQFVRETNRLQGWLDGGMVTRHTDLADYLGWCFERSETPVEIARVFRISVEDGRWRITASTRDSRSKRIAADGIVVTGPGLPRELKVQPHDHPKMLNAASYWIPKNREDVVGLTEGSVLVVGAGAAAANVLSDLVDRCLPTVQLTSMSQRGVELRDESPAIMRLYWDERKWRKLSLRERKKKATKTVEGAVRCVQYDKLRRAFDTYRIHEVKLHAARAEALGGEIFVEDARRTWRRPFDRVVVARGYDELGALKKWLKNVRLGSTRERRGSDLLRNVSERLDRDLALADVSPRLHLPMLAGIPYCLGLPNLTCLGNLSDRILRPYVGR